MQPRNLAVSEMFYSIQGEGPYVGKPALFVRGQGCDFECSWCDTIEVWRKGEKKPVDEWVAHALTHYLHDVTRRSSRNLRLVFTGGNPLLQTAAFCEFSSIMDKRVGHAVQVEWEVQGNMIPMIPEEHRFLMKAHWNVSPKLPSSGVPAKKAIVPEAIEYFVHLATTLVLESVAFKFCIRSGEDLSEMLHLIARFDIPEHLVYVMPVCDTRRGQDEVAAATVKLAIDHGFNYSPRLHLQVWDKKTGV